MRGGFSQAKPYLSHDYRKAFSPLSQGEPRTIARDPMGLNRGQVDRDVADGPVDSGIVGGECWIFVEVRIFRSFITKKS